MNARIRESFHARLDSTIRQTFPAFIEERNWGRAGCIDRNEDNSNKLSSFLAAGGSGFPFTCTRDPS